MNFNVGKAIPVSAWTGSWGSQISRHATQECGKIVSRTHRPPLPSRRYQWYYVDPRAIVKPEELREWHHQASKPRPSGLYAVAQSTAPPSTLSVLLVGNIILELQTTMALFAIMIRGCLFRVGLFICVCVCVCVCRNGPFDTLTMFIITISVTRMYRTSSVVVVPIIWLYITVVLVVISFSVNVSCLFPCCWFEVALRMTAKVAGSMRSALLC